MDVPYKSLSKKAKEIVLFGSGNEKIHLDWKDDSGFEWKQQRPWEGAIPNLERRFRETNSQGIRDAISQYMSNYPCKACNGTRLGETARNVFIDNRQITEITDGSIADTLAYLKSLELAGKDSVIAEKVLDDIISRLQFLSDVGLNYLTLNRSAGTLSGGEAQRIRLASQIGAGLVGVLYILDEPSIGLHQRDNGRLLATLEHLRDIGNTVLVVEHDEEAIRSADHVLDIGPGAGVHGGNVVVSGTVAAIERHNDSITGQYLSGKKKITVPVERESFDFSRSIKLRGATGNNLKKIDVDIPIGLFTCVTGVSGSGKSTLINQTILPIALQALNRAHTKAVKSYDDIKGLSVLDKVVDIDQSPIGRTPRSNPATYTDMFGIIRDLFSQTPESRMRGYKPGRFSFNKKGGRCEECEGDGLIRVEMHFLPDVYVKCDTCQGKRYNRETLEIRYGEKTIADVLDMTVEEAYHFFEPVPKLKAKLATLMDVGLTYIKLGQSATTLSGGEAQRVKLSKELSKRSTGKTLYILDEPTTGLHFEDIRHLLHVLHRLRDSGNTVIVIEHNLDVIKTADWIIDLGPEGGDGGGEIIAVGSPEEVANVRSSFTGQYLRKPLGLDRVSQAAG